ncbi:hypothetical protein EJ08DRAFT_586082 [Tothia fuscella]|uniref:Sin3 binding protein-domain-containing protein n=1 Tax=Tothia fuscella TaxID=1048955 RepID=A0A9P4TZ28_9PEZI|nr:hypothetical protein EJ08DRAFT_586082 [Tothia fuscella]
MAHNVSKPISNLSAGFAAQSASVDVPKHRDAGHPSTSFHPKTKHHNTLPTPPNSISPTLPPHKLRSPNLRSSHPHHHPVDSDIDLQDAVEHAASQGHPQALSTAALSGLEAAGAITPAMLARDHLPDILLGSGPMAIRHVLSHLTQTVPGFSRIPPAKARRIVVGALEGRPGGGPDGNVLFEKVGWGRWDARLRGQPLRDGRVAQANLSQDGVAHRDALSPPASLPGSYALSNASGLQIPRAHHMGDGRRDIYSGASWTGESVISSRDEEMEDMNMAEHEADKMSLDGLDDSGSSPISDDPDDVTDEEDWAGIGPTAPRQITSKKTPRVDYNLLSYSTSARNKSNYLKAMSGQQRRSSSYNHSHSQRGTPYPGGSRGVQDVNTQERDAIEALLRMGSM